jgi:hypothetical protein
VTSIQFICWTAIDGVPPKGTPHGRFRVSIGAAAGTGWVACFLKTDYEEEEISFIESRLWSKGYGEGTPHRP